MNFSLVKIFFVWMAILYSDALFASSAQAIHVEQDAISLARGKVANVLQKYCGDACEVISVDADVDESSSESEELGFESVANDSSQKVSVSRLAIEIQVDDRVSVADQERLGRIVTNSLKTLAPVSSVRWSSVAFPQIGVSAEVEDRLKQNLHQKIHSAVQQTLDNYCPQECVLGNIVVEGKLISPDEAKGVSEKELVRERGGRGTLRIENIDIDISVDEKLPEVNRTKIYNLLKAKTRFAFPVTINLNVVDFPETQTSKSTNDPWGLDRLRQTLQIFRDLAGTKEIITNTSTTSTQATNTNSKESSQSEKSESKESKENSSSTSKEKSSASEKEVSASSSEKSAEVSASEKKQGSENTDTMMYIAGFLVLAGIIVTMIMRFASASRDARAMLEAMPNHQYNQNPSSHANSLPATPNYHQPNESPQVYSPIAVNGNNLTSNVSRDALSIKMKIEYLREELIKAFTDNPKVARDTFTRMLQEEGIEETSRYVHIFGPMIIFDMMNDPNLQRELHDLSEYYYKATFSFNDTQTLELLNNLRTKVTASEIRVMSRKRSEQFDFLQNLDSSQIFALISEERAHVQSVVLTQLDHNRRRAVFEMYEGAGKVELMRELCKADAIPKEYLANVAKALRKKVLSRTEFDTEQLRSSDIIMDLLEKSSLYDQRALMADLVKTNPEAARAIKLKLVTVEMLPYIKDGHLLEIVMGLERDDLLTFLIGAPDQIRELLLSKAPTELAQSWHEDIEQVSGIDDSRYRMAEMRILARVRNLANSGAIRLVDINDRIFAAEHLDQIRRQSSQVEMALSRNSVAA